MRASTGQLCRVGGDLLQAAINYPHIRIPDNPEQDTDATAPHAPWVVRWNSGFASLESLHGRLIEIDTSQARAVFGPLLEGIDTIVDAANDVP